MIYDSGQEVWNLDVPFNYYPDNPPEMDCRFFARWVVDALPPDPDAESWSVIVSHDLNGGHWGAVSIDPHVLMAPVGQSMPSDGLDPEKSIEPVNEGASFRGWSVRFTDPANGSVIYDYTLFDGFDSEFKNFAGKFRSYTQNLGRIAGELQEGVMKSFAAGAR